MTNQLLDYIDDVVCESSYEVISEMLNSCDKAYTILENYYGENEEIFSIIQEEHVSGPYDKLRKEEPKLELRKTKESGKKESIIISILAALPRLIKFAINLIHTKLYNRAVDKANRAFKMSIDLAKAFEESFELFDEDTGKSEKLNESKAIKLFANGGVQTVTGDKTTKIVTEQEVSYVKVPFLKRLRNYLVKQGLKAAVIGGTVYTVKKTGIAQRKYNELKDATIKKIDDTIIAPIKKASDAAAAKINSAVEACTKAMNKAIEFIKKIFNSIKKFVNLKFLGYDQTGEEGIICRMNLKDGSLDCTFDTAYWRSWIDNAKKFVSAAANYVGRKFNSSQVPEKTEDGVRTGVLHAADKQESTEGFATWCARQVFNVHSSAVSATQVMEKMLSKTAKKAEKKANYKPTSSFFDETKKMGEDLDKLNTAALNIIEVYKKRVEEEPSDKNKRLDSEKVILDTLRNIVDTEIHIVNAIDAITDYINSAADVIDAYAIDDSTPTKSTSDDKSDKDDSKKDESKKKDSDEKDSDDKEETEKKDD